MNFFFNFVTKKIVYVFKLRYIDDIFFVTKLKPKELNLANTISRDIRFTLEKLVKNKIHFLDIMTELTTDKILNM